MVGRLEAHSWILGVTWSAVQKSAGTLQVGTLPSYPFNAAFSKLQGCCGSVVRDTMHGNLKVSRSAV